jgi:hypothetical protein
MRWINVIETDRSRNCAYICWKQDDPFWETNIEVNLKWIESLLGYELEDGRHDFIEIQTEKMVSERNK